MFRFRFSIRALFVAILAIGIILFCTRSWVVTVTGQVTAEARARDDFLHTFDTVPALEYRQRPPHFLDFLLPADVASAQQVVGIKVELDAIGDRLQAARHFRDLRHVRFEGCSEVNSALKHLSDNRQIEELICINSDLTDAGLKEIAHLRELTTLRLDDCNVGDLGMHHVRNFRKLRTLGLSGTRVSDEGIASLSGAGLDELRVLSLADTRITDAGMEHVTKLYNIEELTLASSGIRNTERLKALERLRFLEIGSNGLKVKLENVQALEELSISEAAEVTLADMPLLKEIRGLSGAAVTLRDLPGLNFVKIEAADGECRLENLESVEMLLMENCRLASLNVVGMPKLRIVSLVETPVRPMFVRQLQSCKSLRHFSLIRTRLQLECLGELAKIDTLESLLIAGTSISEEESHVLGSFQGLRRLTLTNVDIGKRAVKYLEMSLAGCRIVRNSAPQVKFVAP